MASPSGCASSVDVIRREKQQMRKAIASLGALLTDDDVNTQSQLITQQVLESKWYKDCARLSVYVSTSGEVNTTAIIERSIEDGKQLFIPNFQKGSNRMEMLLLRTVDEYRQLGATLWGIRQHADPVDELSWRHFGPLDVVIVPGVGFTKEGLRLGHGKGFYDRFFSEHRETTSALPYNVGLALRHQLRDTLPTTERDVPLDLVLTAS